MSALRVVKFSRRRRTNQLSLDETVRAAFAVLAREDPERLRTALSGLAYALKDRPALERQVDRLYEASHRASWRASLRALQLQHLEKPVIDLTGDHRPGA